MTKTEAIKRIRKIQTGHCDRYEFPEDLKGSLAKRCWDNDLFSYGFEYGQIWGLMIAFNISIEDLK